MSLAYYIVLDNEEPGFETFVNGKAVAHAIDELDALCDRLGLPMLDSFMGQSADELADLLDEEIELPEGEDPDDDGKWFEPRTGIRLIDALVTALKENPDAVESADSLIEDLTEYHHVLAQAQAIGARWHLAVDI